MSRLFIELFLDEDVDVLVANLVRARGFKATTTQAARKSKDDDEQLAYAVSQRSTLLTHNRVHFERITIIQMIIQYDRSLSENMAWGQEEQAMGK